MRLLIDLQGAQTESRRRGIGRYSIALARAIIRNAGDHEVWIGLSAGLPRTVAYARDAVGDLLPDERFLIWDSVTPTGDMAWSNDGRLGAAQVVREAAIAALAPDVVLCSSVIEGAAESSVSTANRHFAGPRTAVMLYDLIPLLDRRYLQGGLERWYGRRLAELRRADLLLAISESSAKEGRELLGLAPERLVNVRAAADSIFTPLDITPQQENELRERYEIDKPFVMYSGGIDPRKNVHGLISGFAALPKEVRDAHQLVIVGSGDPQMFPGLIAHIKAVGLRPEQVVFTGFVREEDIAPLYNISKAFVFPSKHEGFGLPPLEAMSCGIPTISANNSSLPEVIGNDEAMFDAEDLSAMAKKMLRVLTDDEFREQLRTTGLERARTFSWETSAQLALAALEELAAQPAPCRPEPSAPHRPRLALVTALAAPGTSLRSRVVHLVDQLDAFYDVHVVSTSDEKPWAFEGPARLVNSSDFDKVAGAFDRIVHHYANSPEYGFVREVQAKHPGTVLLDDYYLDRALPKAPSNLSAQSSWMEAVIDGYGYDVLHQQIEDRRRGSSAPRLTLHGPVLQYANGVMVTDPRITELAAQDLGPAAVSGWATVPMLAPGALAHPASEGQNTLVVIGTSGSANLVHRVVPAWLASDVASDPGNQLVIVGVRLDEPYGRLLTDLLAQGNPAARYRFEAGTESAHSSDVRLAVQLSLGPDAAGSRDALDCRARGIEVLTNDDQALLREFSTTDLTRAIDGAWLGDPSVPREPHSGPDRADAYRDAIERFHTDGPLALQFNALRTAARQPDIEPADWPMTVAAVMRNSPVPGPRQLLLDVSSLARIDYRTGIQRVARSLARVMLISPPEGFRVEPVFCDRAGVLRYARTYAASLLGHKVRLHNDPIVARPGDVFVGLDVNDRTFPCQMTSPGLRQIVPMEGALEQLRSRGVSCHFLVYDLLPVRHPEWFAPEMDWFDAYVQGLITRGDGIICDSKATADDVEDWIRDNEPGRVGMPVRWFHLGADLENSAPSAHVTPDFEKRWARRGSGPCILVVGTVEPRKGHDHAIAAFSELWRRGVEANLVIVGRAGWGTSELMGRLPRHPEWGKQLLWFSTASDTELTRLYQASDGFLMPSRGEGFGLPIIEAARHNIPILARDLPVFREIAGDNVHYFSGESADDLADSLQKWFAELAAGTAPKSNGIKYMTWEDSTAQFLEALRKNLSDLGQPTGL